MATPIAYLVKLKPLEPWFFGGEKLSELGNRTDFHQRSTRFPQQTALLGMLRHLLLLHHDQIDGAGKLVDGAEGFIGANSFDVNIEGKYGRIHSLTPVFMRVGDEDYYPAAKDQEFEFLSDLPQTKTSYGAGKHLEFIPFTSKYDPKDARPQVLVSQSGKSIAAEDVFCTKTQPGITKNKTGNKKDGAYYRQEYIGFATAYKEASLAFYATIDEELDGWSNLMLMGGQKSPFMVSFTKAPKPDFQSLRMHVVETAIPWHRLTLISDAFVRADLADLSIFAVNETLSFRNIGSSTSNTRRYGNLKRHHKENDTVDQPLLSGRYSLQERGSVFYFDNDESLAAAEVLLNKEAHFQMIGYNIYKIERKK